MNRQAARHPERHRRDPSKERVCVAYCSGGLPQLNFVSSLTSVYRYDHLHSQRLLRGSEIALMSGPRVAEARSQIVDQFLTSPICEGIDWLWMVDDDMTFEPDCLERLVEAAHPTERPIVGGLCFAGGQGLPMRPTLFRITAEWGDMEPIHDYPHDTLCKVDATGAACLLIHRQVFIGMKAAFGTRADGSNNPYPWFVEGMTNRRGGPYGEDTAFCIKANSLGIPLYVHTGVRLGHVKSFELTEDAYLAQREATV